MTAVPFGKAIVATALPAFRELLTDGENAVLVDYGDVEGLAEALTILIRNPEERNRLAEATASLLKPEARWPAIASKARQCYESLL